MMKKALKPILVLISVLALLIANTSSMACVFWNFREPKMPESLLKRD